MPGNVDPNCPEQLFKLFFDATIVDYICKASNQYTGSLRRHVLLCIGTYKHMTTIDFYNLVGIIVYLGYRKIPRYRFAWSPGSLCYDSFIDKVMSRSRFEGLMSFLHVVDKETEERLKEAGDKLSKVRPLNDHINAKCSLYYLPSPHLSIEERMVLSKARFSYEQYIRNKPTKWGFKLWCLCDAHNGYTVQFSVYKGKTGELWSGKGWGMMLS